VEEIPSDGSGSVRERGILRLRGCFASRNSHSAQDDRFTSSGFGHVITQKESVQ